MTGRSKIPATFDEAEAQLPNEVLIARYGVAKTTLTRWRRQFGVKKHGGGGSVQLPVPPDFAERAPRATNLALARHYHRSLMIIARWRKEAGIPCRRPQRKPVEPRRRYRVPAPVDFAATAAGLSVTALAQHYGQDRKVVQRWLDEAGIVLERAVPVPKVNRGGRRAISGRGPGRPPLSRNAPLPSGRVEEAAQHLRRFTPVYRCGPKGAADPKGKFWRYGAAVLTPAEMVARAERHGFDADAWRRVAGSLIRADALPMEAFR